MKKKKPYNVKIPGDSEDSIVILQERNFYGTYRVLTSQLTLGYKEVGEEEQPQSEINKESSLKKCKSKNVKKRVGVNKKKPMKLRSGLKVIDRKIKVEEKIQVKIGDKSHVNNVKKSKIQSKLRSKGKKKNETQGKEKSKGKGFKRGQKTRIKIKVECQSKVQKLKAGNENKM